MTAAAAISKPQTALPLALIIAGPTASGKSALALAVARAVGGVVINADAMQCYRDLRIITARPHDADLAAAPHVLYGVRAANQIATAAWWRDAALAAMDAAHSAGKLPILCGGSGMYLHSLINGMAPVPDPGADARAQARAELAAIGAPALHAKLATLDPQTAAGLRPADGQRIARAYEVWLGTGRGLAAWQGDPTAKAPWRFGAMVLDPPRDRLRAAIATRFTAMLDGGAVDEVAALLGQNLAPATPLLRAHGVPEISAYLRGEITLAAAAARAVTLTGQYTRRQATWFRHHSLASEPCNNVIVAQMMVNVQFYEIYQSFLDTFLNSPT